jgi:hypothetical protein
MDRKAALDTTLACLKTFVKSHQLDLGEGTSLFAAEGLLDSVNLVAFLMELEQRLTESHGLSLRLISDRALSQKQSPFRTVASLIDFIVDSQRLECSPSL